MIITFWKGVFVADTLDERGALKKAGFQLHEPTVCHLKVEKDKECKACRAKIGRRWWSARVEDATRLEPFCNPKALSVMRQHLELLRKSRATDAKINVPCPEGLAYLPYQKAGVAYAINRKDTMIGDDMGLGKTVQALGFVNFIKPKNVIVICPATLIFNWRNEAERWLMGDWDIVEIESKSDRVPEGDGLFVIVNYEKLPGDSAFSASIVNRTWDVLIADEAHLLKNPESKRSQAVIGEEGLMRKSHRCLFLTGTPIENYPKEIWPLASAISPAKFGNWWEFAKRYCGAHKEERNGRQIWVTEGATHLAELQQRLRASFLVRRLKKDVLPELPPKRRQLIILRDNKHPWKNDPRFRRWQEAIDTDFNAKVAAIESARTEAEFIEAVAAMDKITGIPFEEISETRHLMGTAKLPACKKFLNDMRASTTDPLVIFAHHRDVIEDLTKHFGSDALVVNGQTPHKGPNSREEAVRAFQAGEKQIFIGQMKAAGVGLTLTRANTVVFVEEDWVPGVITQCEDRLCRIGQKKMVHVIHLVLKNTIEVNMVQKMLAKQKVIDAALDRFPTLKLKAS